MVVKAGVVKAGVDKEEEGGEEVEDKEDTKDEGDPTMCVFIVNSPATTQTPVQTDDGNKDRIGSNSSRREW